MKQKTAPDPAAPPKSQPSPRSVAALAALGFVGALLSVFLWLQLVLARSGGPSVCGPEDGGRCGALWDGAFARSVQETTGLPVAAWGLVWALVAFVLPLLELVRQSEKGASPGLIAAIRWTAAGGLGAALGLFTASLTAGAFCLGCAVAQLVAVAYAGIALYAWRRLPLADGGRGAALAGGLALSAFLLLLYPGQHTPGPASGAGALAEAVEASVDATPAPAASAGAPASAGTGDAARDKKLAGLRRGPAPRGQTVAQRLARHLPRGSRRPARPHASARGSGQRARAHHRVHRRALPALRGAARDAEVPAPERARGQLPDRAPPVPARRRLQPGACASPRAIPCAAWPRGRCICMEGNPGRVRLRGGPLLAPPHAPRGPGLCARRSVHTAHAPPVVRRVGPTRRRGSRRTCGRRPVTSSRARRWSW